MTYEFYRFLLDVALVLDRVDFLFVFGCSWLRGRGSAGSVTVIASGAGCTSTVLLDVVARSSSCITLTCCLIAPCTSSLGLLLLVSHCLCMIYDY